MTTTAKTSTQVILKDSLTSLLLYVLPIALMFGWFYISGSRPWETTTSGHLSFRVPAFLEAVFNNLKTWGLPAIMLVVGIV
jgi:membrane protein YdbS with pleckstrin-like domain